MQHFCCVAQRRVLYSGHREFLRQLVRAGRALDQARGPIPMNETTMKPKPAKPAAPVIPMFDVPKFDMPKMEVPAAFREFAEKGIAQTKDAYEKMKATAEQNTEMLETVYATASKGSTEYGLKLIEISRANTN